jgi:hypothetical protein
VRRSARYQAVVAVALAVVATGATVGMLAGRDHRAGPAHPAPSVPHAVALRYAATIGADCPHVAGASALVYAPVPPQWSTGTVGGWTGDGCYGEFFYQHQPGPAVLGPGYVEWTAAGIDAAPVGCSVSIFIADSPHSAGIAHYYVSTLVDGTPRVISDRIINQAVHHGDWVSTGPYHLRGGWLRVDVHPQDPRRRDISAGDIHIYCPAH